MEILLIITSAAAATSAILVAIRTLARVDSVPWHRKGSVQASIVAGVLTIVVALLTVLTADTTISTPPTPIGTIIIPKHNDVVKTQFFVSGRAENIPAGQYLWVATQINDRYWPKSAVRRGINRGWSATIYEEAKNEEEFYVSLLMVNSNGNSQIENWLKEGERTKSFSGLASMDGLTILDIVLVKKLE